MEWGTVSFIFLITFEEENSNCQSEYILDEEYYLFSFCDNDELRYKVTNKSELLKQLNDKIILYADKPAKRKLLGTRKFCSICPSPNPEKGFEDSSELAYSLFYTNKLEKAKQLANGEEVELTYYDYGNIYSIYKD